MQTNHHRYPSKTETGHQQETEVERKKEAVKETGTQNTENMSLATHLRYTGGAELSAIAPTTQENNVYNNGQCHGAYVLILRI